MISYFMVWHFGAVLANYLDLYWEGWNGGIFGGLSLECCIGKIIYIITDSGDIYGITMGLIFE